MRMPSDGSLVADLGWSELTERTWTELLDAGLPRQLVDLSHDLSRRTGRPLSVFTMPTLRVGVAGLAVPFIDDDGIVVDRSILGNPEQLARLVAHELAHMLYPEWSELRADRREEMESFALILAPSLLRRLPTSVDEAQPLVDLALMSVRALRAADLRAPQWAMLAHSS